MAARVAMPAAMPIAGAAVSLVFIIVAATARPVVLMAFVPPAAATFSPTLTTRCGVIFGITVPAAVATTATAPIVIAVSRPGTAVVALVLVAHETAALAAVRHAVAPHASLRLEVKRNRPRRTPTDAALLELLFPLPQWLGKRCFVDAVLLRLGPERE
ncbi:hypothetical protein [Reyranella sp.]|uniref:hypothetical protein n=1 Tax=Reyranella sp. TaxID=1929291 RepID=UPI002F940A61